LELASKTPYTPEWVQRLTALASSTKSAKIAYIFPIFLFDPLYQTYAKAFS
jgi:hypothetical protein